jgi:hypothetical protein
MQLQSADGSNLVQPFSVATDINEVQYLFIDSSLQREGEVLKAVSMHLPVDHDRLLPRFYGKHNKPE